MLFRFEIRKTVKNSEGNKGKTLFFDSYVYQILIYPSFVDVDLPLNNLGK